MVSDKALYWLTLGVLALGVSNSLMKNHAGCLRTLTSSAVSRVQQLSHPADIIVDGSDVDALDRLDDLDRMAEDLPARVQVQLSNLPTDWASRQADWAQRRAEWEQRRVEAINRIQSRRVEELTRRSVRHFVAGRCGQVRVQAPKVVVAVPDDGTI